ncbi:Iron(3+)-hydroxamate-binding protein FhuD precursor [Devosia equisanguinis]|uniref:Iron(3+)-hydroxamate-binding protein FhuD n=1 Tax=Devosia equisanguinis TaxID=2490941 RepID=A0A447I700_9HYPH|nr:ABC transporter substrate-binding protein [Devosia equisanguinis]VDS03310.1 Iron(3+)-hydroxamate-binding protein FhuD precursor [Devosia equisanguinis]
MLFRSLIATTLLLAALAGPAFAQETRSYTAANGTFDIPVAPQRIVALNDQIVALPLYELGAHVVGSAGRIDPKGKPFMRGGMDTLGIDYANTDIAFVGTFDTLDVEAIAALQPDLIIGGPYTDPAVAEQLQKVAPTLIVNNNELGIIETLRAFADITGQAGNFEARLKRYQDNVARTRAYLEHSEDISVTMTFVFPEGAQMWVYRHNGNLGAVAQVVRDLGFKETAAMQALPANEGTISPELIQILDADFIFGFYRQQPDATPATIRAAYEKFAPGFCAALTACRNGQFVLLPGPTFGPTMTGLELTLELIESQLAARPFTPFVEAE